MSLPSRKQTWQMMVALLVVLAACGGEPDPAVEDQVPVQPEAAVETAPQAELRPKINLNTATEEEFLTIPGVGARMVHEFEEYRPYVSIQQFRREIGKYVDEEQVAAYEQYVFVPVDPNQSDAPTLQQLPGVDASEASELVAGRPYASNAAFLEKLGDYITEEERAVAETYLAAQ